MIEITDACNALIDGKLVIAYFGNNSNYEFNHLAVPVEIRLLGDYFCTHTSLRVKNYILFVNILFLDIALSNRVEYLITSIYISPFRLFSPPLTG